MIQWTTDKESYLEFVFSRNGWHNRKDDDRLEVIGNIYLTPELLDTQK